MQRTSAARHTPADAITRALIYSRVSSDPKGRGRSVDEQEQECREVCQREGWDVVKVLQDRDRSASRYAKKGREGWEQAKAAVAAGQCDVLVTWEASRAQRDLDAYVELRGLCAQAGVQWCYSGTTYDLSERADRFRTGLDALIAEESSEQTAERVQRAMRANATRGRPHGRRLYGYRRVYDPTTGELVAQEPDQHEAAVVSEVVARFLAGESQNAIADDLNRRGVDWPATKMSGEVVVRPWTAGRVRRMVGNVAYAGQRVHRGEVVGDAAWPALITVEQAAQVRAKLDDPARVTNRDRRDVRHLLSGIARCGRCGARMYARTAHGYYFCRVGKGHLVRNIRLLDAWITKAVVDRLEAGDVRVTDGSMHREATEARERVAALRAQMDDATDAFVAGELSAQMLGRVEARLLPAIADAERDVRAAVTPASLTGLVGAGARDRWDALDIAQQRDVVRSMLTLTVLPVPSGQNGRHGFDPDTVKVDWLL